ncbi:MAG: TIGR03936 family radical SAM-associated protein [Niameybacter sp.]|uniref:TIGR03936 family radical SAM-associated protein n=1 Tax=Niameybacter sp. TaxID=2033640 RepID=UPI002FC90608
MRIRCKFTKLGYVKFVGHLDTVRMFQRAIRVARIPIAYSQGFNPHAKVYFAMPLSVGVGSTGEYIDIITSVDVDVQKASETLNTILPEGIRILEATAIEEGSPSLMSLVTTANYKVTFAKGQLEVQDLQSIEEKMGSETLVVMKKGKKKTSEVDIKPLIKAFELEVHEDNVDIQLTVAAGSASNLSVDLLLKSLINKELETLDYSVERLELYTGEDNKTVPLIQVGACHA